MASTRAWSAKADHALKPARRLSVTTARPSSDSALTDIALGPSPGSRRWLGRGELDPDGSVIARALPSPHMALDAGGSETLAQGGAQQEMIDAKPGVAGEGV